MEYLELLKKNPKHKFAKGKEGSFRYNAEQALLFDNVAVCIEDNYFVIDLDTPEHPDHAYVEFTGQMLPMDLAKKRNIEKFQKLIKERNIKTFHYQTFSGGWHYWFKKKGSHKKLHDGANHALSCGLFCDTRKSGNNRYVRIRKNKEWLVDPTILEAKDFKKKVATLPDFLLPIRYQFTPKSLLAINAREGERNRILTYMVKLLADHGLDEEQIKISISAANSVLDDPQPEEELAGTVLSEGHVSSVMETAKKTPTEKKLQDLDDLVRKFFTEHKVRVVTDERSNKYLVYIEIKKCYTLIGTPYVEKWLYDNAGIEYSASFTIVKVFIQMIANLVADSNGERLTLEQFINRTLNSKRVLSINNKDYTFSKLGLIEATPTSEVLRFNLGFEYKELNMQCPKLKRVIKWFSLVLNAKSKRTAFFEMIGNILDPSNKLQGFYLLTGEGGNGKSFIMENLVSSLIEPLNYESIKVDMILSSRFETANLENKLLGYDDDMKQIKYGEINALKVISGAKKLKVERKGEQGRMIPSTSAIVASVNSLPTFKDTGESLTRRLQVIEFSTNFSENQELKIEESLLEDDNVRNYFFQQAVACYSEALRRGKVLDTKAKINHVNYNRIEVDDVYTWIQDNVIQITDVIGVVTSELFQKFKYQTDSKIKSGMFTRKLRAHLSEEISTEVRTVNGRSVRTYCLVDRTQEEPEAEYEEYYPYQ